MEDNKNEMSITEAIERCDIMLNAISINGAEKGFANDDNGFPDCVVMKSLIRRCKWALKKQIPMKPNKAVGSLWGIKKEVYVCPVCNYYLTEANSIAVQIIKKVTYCETCGQAIDWSDENADSES